MHSENLLLNWKRVLAFYHSRFNVRRATQKASFFAILSTKSNAMVCNLLVNAFILFSIAAWLLKRAEKHLCHHIREQSSFRTGEYLFLHWFFCCFVFHFAFVLKTDSTHTNNSFKRRKDAIFSLLNLKQHRREIKKNEIQLFIRRTFAATKTRDQNLFWFICNLLHAMILCILSLWTRRME